MAKGKIVYTPIATKAISMDGASYLNLADDSAFDAGTADFNISFLFYVDAAISTANYYKLLVGKGVFDLSSVNGWHIAYNPSNDKIKLSVNDGNASVLESAATLSVTKGVWYWLIANFDRSGSATIYLYNLTSGATTSESLVISTRTNSWSNSEAFQLGNWGATASRYFQGYFGYLRVDMGRAVNTDWIGWEKYRVAYGAPRGHSPDMTETWLFADDLIGESGDEYTLTYNGGTASYVTAAPSGSLSYTFERNYEYETDTGFLPTGVVERAIDGSARSYFLASNKKMRNISFPRAPQSQVAVFWGVWNSKTSFNFYDDADNPCDFTGILMAPPEVRSLAAFDSGYVTYDIRLEIQET